MFNRLNSLFCCRKTITVKYHSPSGGCRLNISNIVQTKDALIVFSELNSSLWGSASSELLSHSARINTNPPDTLPMIHYIVDNSGVFRYDYQKDKYKHTPVSQDEVASQLIGGRMIFGPQHLSISRCRIVPT